MGSREMLYLFGIEENHKPTTMSQAIPPARDLL
jgi:hypothetical protein